MALDDSLGNGQAEAGAHAAALGETLVADPVQGRPAIGDDPIGLVQQSLPQQCRHFVGDTEGSHQNRR